MGIAQNAAAYTLGRKMEPLLRLLILGVLIAIVASLGSALRHLSRGGSEEDSRKMARALTIRIALSLALFALLIIAWYLGLISPHTLQSAPAPAR
jgi:succinate dehydrogenase/fumarate reductase cytochrome b subunit